MFTANRAGYKKGLSQYIIDSLRSESRDNHDEVVLDVDTATAEKWAIKLQKAWRAKIARAYVSDLKQEKNCTRHRERVQAGVTVECEACNRGDKAAEIKHKVDKLRFKEIERLLFADMPSMTIHDTGENWNQRFQAALELPETTQEEKLYKYRLLTSINRDFVSAAVSYAKTIISEYFLHSKDRSILPRNLGGIAGGKKYLWRGILFKLADGSSGPWSGSDEAAAKAAGHDLKGATHYFNLGLEQLHFPLMALIDYRGFRMTAQALLPLRPGSLIYGSADAGKHVCKDDPAFNEVMEEAAKRLNLLVHVVGREQVELAAAVDIEGHKGMDARYYLLDLARAFPPEAPQATPHLDDIIPDDCEVVVPRYDPVNQKVDITVGHVNKSYPDGLRYDILFPDGTIVRKMPADFVRNNRLSVFWRLLRPEFVLSRGEGLLKAKPALSLGSTVKLRLALGKAKKRAAQKLAAAMQDDGDASDLSAYSSFDAKNLDKAIAEMHSKPIGNKAAAGGADAGNPQTAGATSPGEINLQDASAGASYDSFEAGAPAPDSTAQPAAAPATGDGGASYDAFEAGAAPTQSEQAAAGAAGAQGDDEYSLYDRFEPVRTDRPDELDHYAYYYDSFDTNADPQSDIPCANAKQAVPLSPDALTKFCQYDPNLVKQNQDVVEATALLVQEVIPALAERLQQYKPEALLQLNLATELHRHGVNVRHLGLIRFHVPATKENTVLRQQLLLEIVSRTLKNLLKAFQRRWMKSERSTSEQGLLMLVVQFFNLITGSHKNSEEFWSTRVVTGVIQRFGSCALTETETIKLRESCCRPAFLKALVLRVSKMTGVVFSEDASQQFLEDYEPAGFQFVIADIDEVEPVVKYMHIVDYCQALMLTIQASELEAKVDSENRSSSRQARVADRLRTLAKKHFIEAHRSVPADSRPLHHYQMLQDGNHDELLRDRRGSLMAPAPVSAPIARAPSLKEMAVEELPPPAQLILHSSISYDARNFPQSSERPVSGGPLSPVDETKTTDGGDGDEAAKSEEPPKAEATPTQGKYTAQLKFKTMANLAKFMKRS